MLFGKLGIHGISRTVAPCRPGANLNLRSAVKPSRETAAELELEVTRCREENVQFGTLGPDFSRLGVQHRTYLHCLGDCPWQPWCYKYLLSLKAASISIAQWHMTYVLAALAVDTTLAPISHIVVLLPLQLKCKSDCPGVVGSGEAAPRHGVRSGGTAATRFKAHS